MLKIVTGIVIDAQLLGYVLITRTLGSMGLELKNIYGIILRMMKNMDCIEEVNVDEIQKH